MTRSTDQNSAQAIAVSALAFLASDTELLPRFLALAGIEAADIRAAAREPGFLAGVLGFFTAHEPSLLRLSEAIGVSPAEIAAAAHALPIGDERYDRST